MTRKLSLLISWSCSVLLILVPLIAIYCLLDIQALATLARENLRLPIDWSTVTGWQWYSLWGITSLYLMIGLAGLYFLRRAFANFAKGELFNTSNSHDLRYFAILLVAQSIAQPLHFALSSILLSANHSAGNKMLSISFGSNEVKMIASAVVFLVVSNLIIEGRKLQTENQQFI